MHSCIGIYRNNGYVMVSCNGGLNQMRGAVRIRLNYARLANNGLPIEIQKLRCRVNYAALRFTSEIEELGRRVIRILRQNGPFLVLHLRYEMDMLAFSGCTHGCTIEEAEELTRMRYTYFFVRKEILLGPSDLGYFQNHSSQMAALDYMVSLESDIFIPTYDGNMAKVVEGHRRYFYSSVIPDRPKEEDYFYANPQECLQQPPDKPWTSRVRYDGTNLSRTPVA
ncbi:hypothetical protein GW17_00059601 [Ensete ventricosum]|nr:hypothetical protein GW17_00059601 [Ensete ventricosum]